MKRFIIIIVFVSTFNCWTAMAQGVVVNSKFRPMTYGELEMQAYAEAAKQAYNKEQFEIYMAKAYERLQILDYSGFIYYSDYALKFGWYNDKMYYDRGQAYEKLHEYGKAKKEYKKAIKVGYYPATQALEQCKENQKRWKKNK